MVGRKGEPMDKLRELVAQWREFMGDCAIEEIAKPYLQGFANAKRGCADELEAALASLPAAAGRDHLSAEPIAASAPSNLSVGIGPKRKCPRCGEPRACYNCGVMFEDDNECQQCGTAIPAGWKFCDPCVKKSWVP
jgi:hypothetical protein